MLARTSFARAARLRRIPRPLCTTRLISNDKDPKNVDHLIPERPPNWLTRKILESPAVEKWFFRVTDAFGMRTPKAMAQTRTFVLYERLCCIKADEEMAFWRDECALPPTFQSWFTVIALHIWMYTVRFRALPSDYGRRYEDCIVDHFFQDVEDRIRAIMQPSHDYKPYIFTSNFYVNPNAPKTTDTKERLAHTPERIVSQQMKIFKEQWTGLCLALDLGLVNGDMEMAGAVWRNLLGARGASGIAFPDDPSAPAFRRTVNLLGGTVVNPSKIDFDKEAVTDDSSGVHDFPPAEVDKYLAYPELMFDVVQYIRRELVKLEKLTDEEIVDLDWREMRFGPVREDGDFDSRITPPL
ncbi:hypothetical protein B0H16DRAFT_1357299 [Mycena metata]|uniref:Ubiquinol-cytochrome c chaperone domain-containing protein n=1 Tax=Mycena metata TaxID=1033252 RepID=A0AAD7KE15_9AGAR|nr:hypothetical protein B0H16DRAFT_1357299 [Mycena metata]